MAQCPLCRGDIQINALLEAAQCQEDENDGKAVRDSDPFEDIKVDISSTKINAVLRQLEISKQKGERSKSSILSTNEY